MAPAGLRIAAVVVAAAFVLAPTASDGSTPTTCMPAGARPLFAVGAARIYRAVDPDNSFWAIDACDSATGKRFLLGNWTDTFKRWTVDAATLDGTVLAYALAGHTYPARGLPSAAISQVGAIDLQTGMAQPRDQWLGVTGVARHFPVDQKVTSIVANAAGSVAWIGLWTWRGRRFGKPEVHIASGRSPKVFARDSRIAVHSLRLCPAGVCWKQNNHGRSHALSASPWWAGQHQTV